MIEYESAFDSDGKPVKPSDVYKPDDTDYTGSKQNSPQLSLQDKLELLPKEPGCYLFKNKLGKVIYVGKAKVLRNRVRSYFTKGDDGRTLYPQLVASIRDFETIVTDTEVEALILEANLIGRYRPRFNMDVRDDRSYPYMKVTKEPFPRIYLTRNPTGGKAVYYGPLSDVTRIKDTLRVLKQACKIRNCNLLISNDTIKRKKHKVCLEYHIGNCEGPCEGLVSQDHYNDGLKSLISAIQGKSNTLEEMLHDRMKAQAKELKFEAAARTRDQMKIIGNLGQRQKVVSLSAKDRDVFGMQRMDKDACIVVMRFRDGRMVGRSHSYITRLQEDNISDLWERYLTEFYLPETRVVPNEIEVQGPINDEKCELVKTFLDEKRGKKVKIHVPVRGQSKKLVEMARHNAELLLTERQIAREKRDRIPHSLKALKEHLDLDEIPHTIECFDNSNLFGTHPVASMVHFNNGRPVKSEYRTYRIKTVEGIDDFASMREVVGRRYKRLLSEHKELPDLVLIDGGIGQVNAARRILDSLNLHYLPCVGLAKQFEEIVFPFKQETITLPRTSSALKLLMQVRDEAHRFAITFHRKLRSGAAISSTLTSIPGIGEAKARALLRHFGSLKNLKAAQPKDIAQVPGFSEVSGKNLLKLIEDYENSKENENS